LQPGLSKPVALLIDEPPETLEAANAAGYTYFTDPADFKVYVNADVLGWSRSQLASARQAVERIS